jgi:hypothetical protein
MDASRRNRLVVFQAFTEQTDAMGGDGREDDANWSSYGPGEWASVKFGTGEERREAAQKTASLSAVFTVLANPSTDAVLPGTHRIIFDGGVWDIASNVPSIELNAGRDMAATRAS